MFISLLLLSRILKENMKNPAFGNDVINRIQREEYEVQAFGYRVDAIVEEVQDQIAAGIEEIFESLEESIKKQARIKVDKDELSKVTKDVTEICLNFAAQPVKNLEKYMKDTIFYFPASTLLPSDAPQETQFSDEDASRLAEDLEALKQELQRVNFMDACCTEELKRTQNPLQLDEQVLSLDKELSISIKENRQQLDAVRTLRDSWMDVGKLPANNMIKADIIDSDLAKYFS